MRFAVVIGMAACLALVDVAAAETICTNGLMVDSVTGATKVDGNGKPVTCALEAVDAGAGAGVGVGAIAAGVAVAGAVIGGILAATSKNGGSNSCRIVPVSGGGVCM